jgi:hypothetical protein
MEQRGKGCGATTRRIHNDHKTNRQPPEYIQRQKSGIGINHSSAIKGFTQTLINLVMISPALFTVGICLNG